MTTTSPMGLLRHTVARMAPVEALIKRGYPLALAFAESRVPLVRWRGISRTGEPGAVLVAGEEPWVNYLPSLFFASAEERDALGSVPVWQLKQRIERLRSSADLTVIRINRFSASLFLRGTYLAIPAWINAVLHVPEDTRDLAKGNHSLREDLRLVRRGKFEGNVTHADRDLTFFHRSMYVPFMRRRHGDMAFIREESWLRQRCGKGGILWILQAGHRIAGMLFEKRGRVLHLWAEG